MLRLTLAHEDIISNTEWALVKFGAAWCQSCNALNSVLHDIEDMKYKNLQIYEISLDDATSFYMSSKLDIRTVPVLILFNYGKMIWRSGFQSKEEIQRRLEEAKVPKNDTTAI